MRQREGFQGHQSPPQETILGALGPTGTGEAWSAGQPRVPGTECGAKQSSAGCGQQSVRGLRSAWAPGTCLARELLSLLAIFVSS